MTQDHPLSQNVEHGGSALSGILLVAGTCIGAGMLALPVVTAKAGFFPALGINLFCWLFMLMTGLLYLEATLWMDDGAHVLSIAKNLLGFVGETISGIAFGFLYYCLMVAYITGGVHLLFSGISEISIFWGFAFIFAVIVALGSRFIDRVNMILMGGLVISYFLLITIGSSGIHWEYFQKREWWLLVPAAPIFFSAYGYHNIIPSITSYLNRDKKKLRLSILIGTAIPFVVYCMWQWLVIGSVEPETLALAQEQGKSASEVLQSAVHNPWVEKLGTFFGFFAIVTSLLGVSFSMVDFLGDGLNMKRVGFHRIFLCLLVFVPPTVVATFYPSIFLRALSVAGGIGEAFLNGLLPVAMVWMGRYRLRYEKDEMLPGGKTLLLLIAFISFVIMGIEIVSWF